jgi:hypothetical protein
MLVAVCVDIVVVGAVRAVGVAVHLARPFVGLRMGSQPCLKPPTDENEDETQYFNSQQHSNDTTPQAFVPFYFYLVGGAIGMMHR